MIIKTEEKEEKSSDHVIIWIKKLWRQSEWQLLSKLAIVNFCMIFTRFAGLLKCIGIF